MSISLESKRRIPKIDIRQRLRIAREEAGLEQGELAEELGIARQTISNYERGVTPPKKLVVNAWAVATGVDVDWLKTGTTPPEWGGGNQGNVSNLRPTDYKVGASINFPSLKKAS